MDPQTILVVDDEPDIVESIQFRLEREGYRVVTAADGVDALGTLRLNDPDLVILDVMMPRESGYRVSKMIKEDSQSRKISKHIPVILLTARNLKNDPDREKLFSEFSQADAVIYKPFEMDELIQQVRELLAH